MIKESPYLASAASASASPRKKHTRIVMTASGGHETTRTLPPLDINRTTLHHHSSRRSARKSSRGHTVPTMLTPKLGGGASSSKRSHSAASTQNEVMTTAAGTPESQIGGRSRSRNHHYRSHTGSPERRSSKILCTPDRLARRGQILNKIETVRILRARPAFYPIREKPASTSTMAVTFSATSSKSIFGGRNYHDGATTSTTFPPALINDHFELPHNVLGKHITLRMDRSELKRKRRSGLVLPPATNLS
jgi:hypothetical protein